MELNLKPEFEERYKELMGKDYEAFLDYSSRYINKAIRVNTLKISVEDLKKRLKDKWELTPVPWCEEGFWIKHKFEDRFDIGNLPEHQLGYIYVQDPASMIPPIVLSPKKGDKVLDVCAAPGSKTTQLAQYMKNEGILVANDSDGKRLSALGINIQRMGVKNALITHMHGHRLKEDGFDKILVDAPCSGTGTIRKHFKISQMWSPKLVERMANIQYKLLTHAFSLLKPGGIIVYSTCTLEPQENEEVVQKFLDENNNATLEEIDLNINKVEPIKTFKDKKYDKVSNVLRINPQSNDTEGFFVAKIKKIK